MGLQEVAPIGCEFSCLLAHMRRWLSCPQGKQVEARAAYQLALEKSQPESQYRQLIEVKLDALGESK